MAVGVKIWRGENEMAACQWREMSAAENVEKMKMKSHGVISYQWPAMAGERKHQLAASLWRGAGVSRRSAINVA
jgi:hypothetical protein